MLWAIGGGIADADTVSVDAYRIRLRQARSLVLAVRSAPTAQRAPLLAQAAALLRTTDALALSDGSTLPIDDGALASRLGGPDDYGLSAALADLDARIAIADGAAASNLTGASVDAALRAVLPPKREAAGGDPGPLLGLLALLLGLLVRAWDFVARGVLGVVDPRAVYVTVGGLGLAIALLVLGVLGRGVRERVRREAFAGDVRAGGAEDPAAHLRRADAAIAAGRTREALHELYLFAIAVLAARETIRFDPALTDRELLARAAAIPQIGSLRALVDLHERIWFGLKPAGSDDAVRARDLAQRVAA